MSGEYVISEDKDYKKGNGVRAYIKDGTFICSVANECGNAGGGWLCDIELLRYHIENYKQGVKGESAMNTSTNEQYIKELEEKVDKLETLIYDLVKTINTQTAMMKPVVFVAEDEDKVAEIKKFLNENALDI